MQKIGLFPGSFDPFTKGHEVVVRKSLSVFDEVIIGIGVNSQKKSMFSLDSRKSHIASLFSDCDNVRVLDFQKLTVEFCKDISATHIIRGLRNSQDFEYEKSIAHMNHAISDIETVFFLTDPEFGAINSTIIREIHSNGATIDKFVTHANILVG